MIDNKEINEVMAILEEMEDEQMAITLLKELNLKTKALGDLLMNKDPDLDSEKWKKLCDDAKLDVDKLITEIKNN